MNKAILLSPQFRHAERFRVFQAGVHAYVGEPYSQKECLARAQSLMELYCDLKPQQEICYTLAFAKALSSIHGPSRCCSTVGGSRCPASSSP